MPDGLAPSAAEAHEAAVFRAIVKTARQRQQAALAKSPHPPRFLLESAQSMAAHLGMSEARMLEGVGPMALWQLYYLPAALGANTWDFADIEANMPWSFHRLRAALAPIRSRPQLVTTVFHMAAFPAICTLIGAVWRGMHEGPLHLLVASRNAGWFRVGANQWVGNAVEVVSTDGPGLRTLLTGLKSGIIQRLLILADGPQAPGTPGARTLDGVSPALAFRTTLMAKIHALGIPLIPITHEWDADRLLVTPQPMLDPAELGEAQTMDAVAEHIEDLLRRHPEQWLNWSAARIRT